MSPQLILLTLFMAGLSGVALVRPKLLFTYPVAAGLLMLAFIVPQAWQLESTGRGFEFDPPFTWTYMILCMAALCLGFVGTSRWRAKADGGPRDTIETFLQTYRVDRLFHGCVALVITGAVSWVLMIREAAASEHGSQWTGVITLYALLCSLLLYGASLSWLLYLYTRDRKTLVLAIVGLSFSVPTVLFSARRELAFDLATSLLLGLYFVRGKTISRFLLLPMVLLGGIYVNQASAIRSYIRTNDASLVGALASRDVTDLSEGVHTSEVLFAISDIAQTQWSNQYELFGPYWNTLVQLYFPAFIFGREAKDNAKLDLDIYATSHTVASENGATHTGFSDSFIEFHYFGAAIFFVIAAILGYFWRRAREGDIGAQLYYMLLLTQAMMTITESTSLFVGKSPFLFVIMGGVFLYARRPKPRAGAVPRFTGGPMSPAAQLQRSRTRLQIDR